MSHILFGSIYQLCDIPAIAVTVCSKSFGVPVGSMSVFVIFKLAQLL